MVETRGKHRLPKGSKVKDNEQAPRAIGVLLVLILGVIVASQVLGCIVNDPPASHPSEQIGKRCVVDEKGNVICIVEDDGNILRHVSDITPAPVPRPQKPDRRRPIGIDKIGESPEESEQK